MIKTLGTLCVVAAVSLDMTSYFKQISKTLRERNSSQVSTSFYLYKIVKVAFSLLGLAIYANYVGMGMELFMLGVYVTSLIIIARFKPKGWKLWN